MYRKAFILLLLILGCAPVRVQLDYDPGAVFENYSSYGIAPGLDSGLSELDERRLLESAGTVLQTRGFRLSDDPDLLLDIRTVVYQDPVQPSVGVGMGGTSGNVAGGMSVGLPVNSGQLQREIAFEMRDARQGRTLWQAVSMDRVPERPRPAQREERMRAIAEKVFGDFPPKNP